MAGRKILEISQEGWEGAVASGDGRNVHWTDDKNVEMPIKMIMEGPAEGRMKPETIVEVFVRTVDRFTSKTAMSVERDGQVFSWSWTQYMEQTMLFAKAMEHLEV
jgi:hypothetical protein